MNKTEIETLLHHRDPYLMVSSVEKIEANFIETTKKHHGDEFYIQGHFPGAPIVPGAMLQELCTQSAGLLISKFHSPVENYNSNTTKGWALGVLNKVEFAKFLSIAKTNIDLNSKVELIERNENLFKFRAKVYQGEDLKAKFKFNLMNISDNYLTDH